MAPRQKRQLDHVDRAIAYAREATDRRNVDRFGKWIRLACRRFIADLKHAATRRPRFTFDRDWANRACQFIELLPHVEGRWATPTIVLHPSQILFVVALFGFRNFGGGRRFTSALFAVARKNGKSSLAAAILLAIYCLEEEVGAQIYTAATTGQQARIVWGIAKRMVEMTPDLQDAFGLKAWANAIANYQVGGTFRPINSKASAQDGLNPSATGIDEVHAHKTHDLINVLQSAAGARDNPLWLFTTTEGYENAGPWSEIRHMAFQVLEGVIEADHFLALYFGVDADDDDFDPTAWRKANPLWDVNPKIGIAIEKEMIEARAMPGKLAELRIKRLNRPSAAATAHIDIRKWRRCAGTLDLDLLVGKPCWAGFDLSSTTDLTSWRLVWLFENHWYTWGRRWVPAEAAAHRTQRGSATYTGWIEAGLIEQCAGDTIDYHLVEQRIRTDVARFQPKVIAFDPWNAQALANNLLADGMPLVQFRQGTRSYHPAMQEVDRAYREGRFVHGGDPVLTWCASNLVPRKDENGNMAPDKKRSPDKIDDMCSLYMGVGVALVPTEQPFDFATAVEPIKGKFR